MSESSNAPLQTTRISPRWLVKTSIFLIVALALSGWFALDAMVIYPKRGRTDAAFLQQAYLNTARTSGALFTASVAKPKDELETLRAKGDAAMTPLERSRFLWLESLAKVESLSRTQAWNEANPGRASSTVFPDPAARLAELDAELASKSQPKALDAYDIPLQYAMLVLCAAVSLWIIFVLLRVLSTKYRYDAATATLTLPGKGGTVSAASLVLLDKRKWDKFYAFLKVQDRPGEIKLDLYRFVPLEEWVLDMWKRSPNYDPADEEQGDEPSDKAGDVGDADVMSSADLPAM